MKYLFTLMIALLPLTIIGQGSSIRALNGLGTNITLRGQNIIRTNLLVDGSGSGTIGGTNVLEVQTVAGLKAFQVSTNQNTYLTGDGIRLVLNSATDPTNYRLILQQDWSADHPFSFYSVMANGNEAEFIGRYGNKLRLGGIPATSEIDGVQIATTLTATNGIIAYGDSSVSNLTVNGTANVATNLIVNTNTYLGPTNSTVGQTFIKIDGGATGATGNVFEYTTNGVTKLNVTTAGAMTLNGQFLLTGSTALRLNDSSKGIEFLNGNSVTQSYITPGGTTERNTLNLLGTGTTVTLTNLSFGLTGQSTNVNLRHDWGNNPPTLTIVNGVGNAANLVVSGTLYAAASYFTNDCSALTFTDRSEAPETVEDAVRVVQSIVSVDGHVDHSVLDPLAWGKKTVQVDTGLTETKTVPAVLDDQGVEVEPAKKVVIPIIETQIQPDSTKRNLSMLVSAQALVIQDLLKRIEKLEAK